MPSDDKFAEIVARFPGPVTLYPSRKKWLVVCLGGSAFTIGGIRMIQSGDNSGWFVAGFFAPVAIIAAAILLPGAGRLTLDQDGFEAISLYRRNRTRWRDTHSPWRTGSNALKRLADRDA